MRCNIDYGEARADIDMNLHETRPESKICDLDQVMKPVLELCAQAYCAIDWQTMEPGL